MTHLELLILLSLLHVVFIAPFVGSSGRPWWWWETGSWRACTIARTRVEAVVFVVMVLLSNVVVVVVVATGGSGDMMITRTRISWMAPKMAGVLEKGCWQFETGDVAP